MPAVSVWHLGVRPRLQADCPRRYETSNETEEQGHYGTDHVDRAARNVTRIVLVHLPSHRSRTWRLLGAAPWAHPGGVLHRRLGGRSPLSPHRTSGERRLWIAAAKRHCSGGGRCPPYHHLERRSHNPLPGTQPL